MPANASFEGDLLGHGTEASPSTATGGFPLKTVDLSDCADRRVIIAQGTPEFYHGHPTTLQISAGGRIFCVWTNGHGGACGLMKYSDDGGRTWSPYMNLPENWRTARNCPTIFRLADSTGKYRLFVFAGQGSDQCMQVSWSENEGETWSPMQSTGLRCVMPFCAILPIEGGKRLIGLTNIRRNLVEEPNERSNVLAQSYSEDGGFTWSSWKVILDDISHKYCEPWVVISPARDEWLCLIRENLHQMSYGMTSHDEGAHWSKAKMLPIGVAGDRHIACYAPDGRLVVVFRDRARSSGTFGDYVAWVGRYEDLVAGRNGGYRIKLLHSYNGADCGYSGLECLEDGSFFATTYIKYRKGLEKNSIVGVRFSLSETDRMALENGFQPPAVSVENRNR